MPWMPPVGDPGALSPAALTYEKRTEMPQTGTEWTSNPAATDKNGYKKDDCLYNLAWNQLEATGKGAQNDPNAVMTRVSQLVEEYNKTAASSGAQPITNENDVTSGQISSVEKTYTANNPDTGQWW
jgi:hypothetical protein